MAPEQWEGNPVPATDQYALAVMSYELLTGQPLFQGNPSQMMFKHLTVTPPPPSTLNPQLPRALDSVLLRGLEKKPEMRFPKVIDFAHHLQHALQGINFSTVVRPDTVPGAAASRMTPGKPVQPNNTPVISTSETNIPTVRSNRNSSPSNPNIPNIPRQPTPGVRQEQMGHMSGTHNRGMPPVVPDSDAKVTRPDIYHNRPTAEAQAGRSSPRFHTSETITGSPTPSRQPYQPITPVNPQTERSSGARVALVSVVVILLLAGSIGIFALFSHQNTGPGASTDYSATYTAIAQTNADTATAIAGIADVNARNAASTTAAQNSQNAANTATAQKNQDAANTAAAQKSQDAANTATTQKNQDAANTAAAQKSQDAANTAAAQTAIAVPNNMAATATAQTATAIQKNIASAKLTLDNFCSALVNPSTTGDYSNAYSYLSARYQGQVSLTQFNQAFSSPQPPVTSCKHDNETSYSDTQIVFPLHWVRTDATTQQPTNQDVVAYVVLDAAGNWKIDNITNS